MICSNCGTENRAGAKFCMECATPFATSCPNCGAANNPAAKFCSECATPMGEGAPHPKRGLFVTVHTREAGPWGRWNADET